MAEKHFNAAGTHVLVYNPELDARWECGPDYLSTALARGWELAEPVVEEVPADVVQSAPKPARKTRKKAASDADPTPPEEAK